MLVTLDSVKDKIFDYVIVGGGTSGLVLAARLTEDPNVTVCVLEAGDAHTEDQNITRTGMSGVHFGNAAYDWSRSTTEQKYLVDGRVCAMASGRGLGGSSAINFMMWTRPPAEEIDDFERLGNPGWNWSNLLRYCNKAERFVEPDSELQDTLQIPYTKWSLGRNGPLPVSFPSVTSELSAHMHQTFLNAGIPEAEDPYGGKSAGAYFNLQTLNSKTYSRSYAVTEYYIPNQHRANFNVLVNARVNRIRFETTSQSGLRATGVNMSFDGIVHFVKARREVLLCAGAIESPHILELSGIGRPAVLNNLGISPLVNLPGVGENLQEHLLTAVRYELRDGLDYPTMDVLRDASKIAAETELYKQGKGSFLLGPMNIAFLPVESVTSRGLDIYEKAKQTISNIDQTPGLLEQYEIQLERLKPGEGQTGPGCEIVLTPGITMRTVKTPLGKKFIGFTLSANHTFSRGTTHAVSDDPNHQPEIDPRYFEHGVDLDVMVEMIKYARRLAQVPPLRDIIVREFTPGPEVQTDEQIAEWLKRNFSTTWHTAGTCSMLPREKGGVVDPKLKVYGTENLRVIDLSIVPLHFAAHSQSMVYGIAELAADIVKGHFNN